MLRQRIQGSRFLVSLKSFSEINHPFLPYPSIINTTLFHPLPRALWNITFYSIPSVMDRTSLPSEGSTTSLPGSEGIEGPPRKPPSSVEPEKQEKDTSDRTQMKLWMKKVYCRPFRKCQHLHSFIIFVLWCREDCRFLPSDGTVCHTK